MSGNLIVCVSVSHGNTRRIAEAIADPLGADIVAPEQADPATLLDYDLVGFGSGIFNQRFHPRLRELVAAMPLRSSPLGAAFLFSTSGFPPVVGPFAARVRRRGFSIVGTYGCRGWDTSPPFGAFGGIRRSRPDATDLARARRFGCGLAG